MNALVQATLVPSCLVLGHDALVNHAVNDRNGSFISSLGSFLVACVTFFDDILDLGTHQGTQTHVVLAGLLRLPGAFLC